MTREEAIAYIREWLKDEFALNGGDREVLQMAIEALSADADGEDLIIKGAKGIQDGLYNITDGKLFKYKAKGGTVRTYPIVPSAEDAQGWIPCSERLPSEDGQYLVCMAWEYYNMEVLRWADGWNCHRGYDGKISRESEIDGADIIAWMPLPTPYAE